MYRVITPIIMDNQIQKELEHETETCVYIGCMFIHLALCLDFFHVAALACNINSCFCKSQCLWFCASFPAATPP